MRTINAIKFGIIAIAIAAASQTNVIAQAKDGGGRLAGTWDTVVTIRNCATGDAITSFQSVGSFNEGGTFSGISSGTSAALRSPETGVWKHVAANVYQFRFKAYTFNAMGVAVSYAVITHELELNADADEWESSGINEIFNMNGAPIATGCSTATATRMNIE
jgi:hypothetical protein